MPNTNTVRHRERLTPRASLSAPPPTPARTHPAPTSNTYTLTPEGIRVAVFYAKLQNRLLRPLLDADKPPAPIEVRRAITTLERAVDRYINDARLAPAA